MAEDLLTALLGEAVRDLVLFVENRPAGATADYDVKALEGFAHVMSQVPASDRGRLRSILGSQVYDMLGWEQ